MEQNGMNNICCFSSRISRVISPFRFIRFLSLFTVGNDAPKWKEKKREQKKTKTKKKMDKYIQHFYFHVFRLPHNHIIFFSFFIYSFSFNFNNILTASLIFLSNGI